jgi:hypothetical protein
VLYKRALGPAFDALPPALQGFHAGPASQVFDGHAEMRHGTAIARLCVRLAGFPAGVGRVPLRLTVTRNDDGEVWERDFGGHVTRSRQWLAGPGLIAERIGPATVLMRPVVDGPALRLPIVGLRGAGVPLPAGLLSQGGGWSAWTMTVPSCSTSARRPGA